MNEFTEQENTKNKRALAGQDEPLAISLCIYCAKRADCMPGYDDDTLNRGAKDGHTPICEEECIYYLIGDSSTRERALVEREEFNIYAENLIKGFVL